MLSIGAVLSVPLSTGPPSGAPLSTGTGAMGSIGRAPQALPGDIPHAVLSMASRQLRTFGMFVAPKVPFDGWLPVQAW